MDPSRALLAPLNRGPLVLEAAIVSCAVFMASLSLARALSQRFSKSYRQLSTEDQLDWAGKSPSTQHAVIITAATFYIFLATDTFAAEKAQPFVLRTSQLSNAALGFSCGYFVTDLIMLVLHYPVFGGPALAVHHLAALASVAAAALQGQGHAYTLALLATECTTPFVNARWLLDKAGYRDSAVYKYNGLALLASWFTGRLLLFGFFFHHLHDHRHELQHLSLVSKALVLGVPALLFLLNLFWFSKILKGAIKVLLGGKTGGGNSKRGSAIRAATAAQADDNQELLSAASKED